MNAHFDEHLFETAAFHTCDLGRCRPGVARALQGTLRRIEAGEPTTAIVVSPRYGKSNIIRQLAIELMERNLVGACIVLSPWKFLRDQLNDIGKIKDMVRHHSISRPNPIIPDILSGKIDPAFYNVTPLRRWWSLTVSQAYQEQTKRTLCDLAAQFKYDKKPLVVFIDEAQLISTGDYGWGKLAAELKAAGALLVLLTGTPERADNIAAFGFRTEEVERTEHQYKIATRISDEETRVDFFEAQKVKYRVISDVPMVGLQQAWSEQAITKLQHRFFAFKADGELIFDVSNRKARRALGVALRDPRIIRIAVREMLDELHLRRQTDGDHGNSEPTTGAIIFVGNDRVDDEGNDWHAREVQRIIKDEWPNYFQGSPKIQITTRETAGEDSDKAAEMIKQFADGDGHVIIVKQMGGVGLDAPRLKVGLDLSTIRTKSNTTQRWLRIATLWKNVTHGTMILPNDPITAQLWEDIVQAQGGQYSIENATLVDSKTVKPGEDKIEPKPVITDPQRGGSIDQSLRLVDADLDQKLDMILVKSPLFAIRFTRRELADEFEKGTFSDIIVDDPFAEPTVGVFNVTSEIDKKSELINAHCTALANREAAYSKQNTREQNERWINVRKRWMSEAKMRAGIRGELKVCRDLDRLTSAEGWLESQLGRADHADPFA